MCNKYIYMYGNHLRDSRSICRKNIATFLPWLFSFPRVLNHVRHIPGKISGYFHGTTRYLHTIAHAKNYNKSTEAKEKKMCHFRLAVGRKIEALIYRKHLVENRG